MPLINLQGLTVIGPGSEWFWGAVSGIVLAVTFVAIYRQLRLQRGQAAIEQLEAFEREYSSERLLRCRLALARAERDGRAPADLPQDIGAPVLNYWERVASLARHGYLDLDLLWEGGSGFWCYRDWLRLEPSITKGRVDDSNPEVGIHFEWLAGTMAARAPKFGVRLPTRADIVNELPTSIATLESLIRLEVQLRTGGEAATTDRPGRRPTAAGS